jgi:PAS domain S-box-containing protein
MKERGESGGAPAAEQSRPSLQPTDAWFRSVVEAANEGIWIIDMEARTIFANERMAAMLGTTLDRMAGKTPFDFLYAEDFDRAREVMTSNYHGTPVEFEILFRREDGTDIPVLAGSAPLRDDSGNITGSVATFSDMTLHKGAEAALIQREQESHRTAALLNQLLEAATDAIWMRDMEGVFRVANPAACKVMGGDREQIIGRSMYEIWGVDIARHLASEAEEIVQAGHGISVEEEMYDSGRGGPTIFLSNKVPIYSHAGEPIGILGVSRDITNRKHNEIELRESRTRLAEQLAELNALYESAPIGLGFFDREYRYVRINEELAAINGVPAELHIGRTIREVLSDDAPPVEPVIDQVFATGESVRFETSGQTPQQPGVLRHWLAGFYPVKSIDGEVQAVGAWVVEISDRKAAEQREQLLAREVDHRAKNLLAVVQSVVQLTRAESTEDLKAAVLGRIQSLANAHALLADARWDGVELSHLVAEELAPFSDGKLQQATYEGPPILLRPSAAQSLALVLHELATNAAKYGALSTADGRLHVHWSLIEVPRSLLIVWSEQSSGPVSPPSRAGFGSRIIATSVERQLRGKLDQQWTDQGLQCRIEFPLENVAA